MTRIPIRLQDESLDALHTLAKQEYRDIRQQAAWIIEQELERRGLLVIPQSFPAVDPSPIMPKRKSNKRAKEILSAMTA